MQHIICNCVFAASTMFGKDRCSPSPYTSAKGEDCFTNCKKEYHHYKCHVDETHTTLDDCGFWNHPRAGKIEYTINNQVKMTYNI